jgi:hypothetical protein
MKCLLCNEKIDVVRHQRVPKGLFLAMDENGNLSVRSPAMHMHCVLKMKDQLEQLTAEKGENK